MNYRVTREHHYAEKFLDCTCVWRQVARRSIVLPRGSRSCANDWEDVGKVSWICNARLFIDGIRACVSLSVGQGDATLNDGERAGIIQVAASRPAIFEFPPFSNRIPLSVAITRWYFSKETHDRYRTRCSLFITRCLNNFSMARRLLPSLARTNDAKIIPFTPRRRRGLSRWIAFRDMLIIDERKLERRDLFLEIYRHEVCSTWKSMNERDRPR